MGKVVKLSYAIAAMIVAVQCGASESSVSFVVVNKLPPSEVTSRVQAKCLQAGMSIESATATQVICSKPMDDSFKSLFIRALATPNYSTNPIYRYRVNAVQVGDQTTVSAETYVQYQNAYGQQTTIPITNKKELASTKAGLETMKATWEAKLLAEEPSTEPMQRESTPPASTQPSALVPSLNLDRAAAAASAAALANPSGSSAKSEYIKLGCPDAFALIISSAGRSIFEATCRSGKRQLLECYGAGCRPLN